MKTSFAIIALLLVSAQSAQSEICRDKFIHFMTEYKGFFPVKNHIVSKPKGGKASTNKFYMTKIGHWMTEMITPPSPWTLAYNNTMYTSSDKGKTWKKVRTMDSAKNNENTKRDQLKNAETVKNAKCGEEEYKGVMHDTVEAEYSYLQFASAKIISKYWVDRKTGYVAKNTSDLNSKSYSSFTTQETEPAPGLVLPTPE